MKYREDKFVGVRRETGVSEVCRARFRFGARARNDCVISLPGVGAGGDRRSGLSR